MSSLQGIVPVVASTERSSEIKCHMSLCKRRSHFRSARIRVYLSCGVELEISGVFFCYDSNIYII